MTCCFVAAGCGRSDSARPRGAKGPTSDGGPLSAPADSSANAASECARERDTLATEAAKARAEIVTLQKHVATLDEENKQLKETAQHYFDAGTAALNEAHIDGRLDEAEAAFQSLLARFPNDPLAKNAQAGLALVRDQKLAAVVEHLDVELDFDDKESYARAAAQLAEAIRACPKCRHQPEAARKLAAIKGTMADWPVSVPNLKTLQVRYGDLRGKRVLMEGRYLVEAGTYYNCGFNSQSRWRSFRIQDASRESVHGYCRRGAEDCEGLLTAAADHESVVSGLLLKYPRGNAICEEGQIEMLAWD